MHPHSYPTPRPRIPAGLFVAALVLVLVPALLVLAWLAWQWHTLEASYPLVADTLRIAVFLLPLALGGYGVAMGIAIAYRRWGTDAYIKAHHITQLKRAEVQVAPLATSFTYHHAPEVTSTSTVPALALPDAGSPIAVPTFAQLLDAGAVAADREFILGYGADGAITGDWKSLYSASIGGLQGSGKSWTAAYLLAQSALHGAQLVICDPHAGDSESLAHRVGALAPAFLCRIADDDGSIHAALKLADDVLQARKRGAADRTPVIVAVDEWSALRRGKLADLLPLLVEDFSTEGRKLNCHILLLGQRWDKASVGDFRNTLASSYVHRMRADEARMMTGLPAGVLPANTLSLKPGESYFISTRGDMARVQIPLMTPADMARVGQLLSTQTPSAPGSAAADTRRTMGFQPVAKTEPLPPVAMPAISQPSASADAAYAQAQRGQTPTAEAVRVLALFLAGKSPAEIVLELRGIKSNEGAKYQRAAADILEMIRLSIKAGAQ